MTLTGIVLCKEGAQNAALLSEYTMYGLSGVKAVSTVVCADAAKLEKKIGQPHHNSSKAVLIAAYDSDVNWGKVIDERFCVSENTCFVSRNGDFLGAVVLRSATLEELLSNAPKRVIPGKKILPSNFIRIMNARRKAVQKRLVKSGVFVEDEYPAISPLAVIESGSYIGKNVRIEGKSVIGKNCVITGASRLCDATVGDGCTVESAVILQSTVGNRTTVGPFAYIRPGSAIGNSVKVGDFVEVKNAVIGDGTKISHLTYVGDSDVGAGVNFGCGTVTVNYDGRKKYRTVIGDHVFIGCNTNLVAPVTVGDNAFIAAGSTITDEIPPKSFAIARQKQTTKEDYVTQKMPDMIKE